MTSRELAERQRIEIEHWKQSPRENPESDIVTSFLKKAGEALILLDLIRRYRPVFERARTILELGAGHLDLEMGVPVPGPAGWLLRLAQLRAGRAQRLARSGFLLRLGAPFRRPSPYPARGRTGSEARTSLPLSL
jgi:hypothetical protein